MGTFVDVSNGFVDKPHCRWCLLVFCGFGRSMLFTLPLVGWVIRSILETDHVLKYHKLFGQVQWLWVFKQVAKSLEGELKLARQMP